MNPSHENTSTPPARPAYAAAPDEEDDAVFRPQRRNQRRKKRRLRSTTRYWLCLAGMAAGGMLAAYVAFLLIVKIVHPYKLGHEVGAQVAELRAKRDREERANALLRERVAFLRTPEGAEVTARRNGWHRKGETVYLLPVTADGPDSAGPAAAPAAK